jgi:hypothetical protein
MGYYYRYPIEFFKDKPDTCYFIRYDNLVQDPEAMVREVYDFLDIVISDDFATILHTDAEKSRSFQSEHVYSLEAMDLTSDQILENFSSVFDFYEFGTEKTVLPEKGMLIKIRDWQLARKQRRRLRAKKRRRLLRRKEFRLD